VSIRTDIFDLAGLRLTSGEGRRLTLAVELDPLRLAEQRYVIEPVPLEARLDISRTTGDGYALRLRFTARVVGPCMRCLAPAAPELAVDAREVSLPGIGEELESPYVDGGELDLRGWARDALALMLPTQILCRPDCIGLCPQCGVNLAEAGPDHAHEREPDPRWAKLSELRIDP
jgi:uncharacterized protein